MGNTYSAVHAQTEDRAALISALSSALAAGGYRRRTDSKSSASGATNAFYVSPPLDGWTTVYPSNDLDGREFFWAEVISRIGCSALWLYLFDSTFFMFRLYRDGQLVERYHSTMVGDKAASANPRALRPWLVPGATVEDLDRALRPDKDDEQDAESRFLAVARLFGIETASNSFAIVQSEGPAVLHPRGEDWELIEFDYYGVET